MCYLTEEALHLQVKWRWQFVPDWRTEFTCGPFVWVCIVAEKCQDAAGKEFPQSQWPILCHSSSACYHLCTTLRFVFCNDAGLLVTWLLVVFAFCGIGAWSRDPWDWHAIMAACQYIYTHVHTNNEGLHQMFTTIPEVSETYLQRPWPGILRHQLK